MTNYGKTMMEALAEVRGIKEDGHTDVASAMRQCKTMTEDAMQILQKLQTMSPEDSLPSWWTNKLAVASNSMNKLRDYIIVPTNEHHQKDENGNTIPHDDEEVELDEAAGDLSDMKKLVGELQNASKMHLAQSKRVKAHVDMMKGSKDLESIVGELEKASQAHLRQSKSIDAHVKLMGEEVELDEGKMKDLLIKGQDLEAYAKKHGGIDKKDMMKVAAMLKKGDKSGALKYAKGMDTDPRDYILDLMGEEPEVDKIVATAKNKSDAAVSGAKDSMMTALKAQKKKKGDNEEELDEKYDLYHKTFSDAMQHAYKMAKKLYGITIDKKEIDDKVATGPRKPGTGKTNTYRLKGDKGAIQVQVYNKGGSKPFELNMYKEEVQIKEQPEHEITVGNYTTKFFYMCGSAQKVMKQNADKEGAEELTRMQDDFYKLEKEVMDAGEASDEQIEKAKGMYNKIMQKAGEVGLADEIDGYMKSHIDSVEKGDPKPGFGRTDMKESARADARRAMRRDPDMRQVAFGKDDAATDADIKGASKNILAQMRKASNLGGTFGVEFLDKKKVKVKPEIARAFIKKYQSIRKPDDKEKFQNKAMKSYKDMLKVLKAGHHPEETILTRIDRKIQERRNG